MLPLKITIQWGMGSFGMSDALALEKKLSDISPGERVTLDDINNAIISEHYFTGDLAFGAFNQAAPEPMKLLTFCVLILWNGFTVTGQSACVDPANYNQDIGRKIARENAIKQIWPLLGFDLASRRQRQKELLEKALVLPQEGFKTYIGTKVINAKPMNRLEYNHLRGWQLPAGEHPLDPGYIVEYTDNLQNNVEGFGGYISWSPKYVFESAYQEAFRG
jgi:hypothetical protein